MSQYNIQRGDIFFVDKYHSTGSEQFAGRPAIIVSNDDNNKNSDVVEVVYLTTAPKRDLPTHVTIRSTNRVSTALCEQITSVDVSRLGNYICQCNTSEMQAIDAALLISLGIEDINPPIEFPDDTGVAPDETDELRYELEATTKNMDELRAQLREARLQLEVGRQREQIIREMYESLLDRSMRA